MVRKITVLRSGGEFTEAHAEWLARQVPELWCLTDLQPDMPRVILDFHWPGWFSKMELFDPALAGDLLYLDLDTVVLGDLDELIEATGGQTTLLSDFYSPEFAASGFMYIAERDKQKVWGHWLAGPEVHMQRARTRECWGDQGIISEALGPVQRWQDVAPGKVASYKTGARTGASVVCFHGNPRPWDSGAGWVPALNCD